MWEGGQADSAAAVHEVARSGRVLVDHPTREGAVGARRATPAGTRLDWGHALLRAPSLLSEQSRVTLDLDELIGELRKNSNEPQKKNGMGWSFPVH